MDKPVLKRSHVSHATEHMGTLTDVEEDDSVMNSNRNNSAAIDKSLTEISPRMDTPASAGPNSIDLGTTAGKGEQPEE